MSEEFDMIRDMQEHYNKNLALQYAAPELLKAARLALGTLEALRPALLGREVEMKYLIEAVEELKKAITRSCTKDIIQEHHHET